MRQVQLQQGREVVGVICSVEGCERPARSSRPGADCTRHATRRHRGRPNSSPDLLRQPGPWISPTDGEITIYSPAHPLAQRRGLLRMRRAVALRAWGAGFHPCERCGRLLAWGVDLLVAVRDGDPANVSPANLLATCRRCVGREVAARSRNSNGTFGTL